jgi:hypothetical protein
VAEVVRYLRQQDDVVVPHGNGMFLVNGRFNLRLSELVDKANRIRRRQNKPLFKIIDATFQTSEVKLGPNANGHLT